MIAASRCLKFSSTSASFAALALLAISFAAIKETCRSSICFRSASWASLFFANSSSSFFCAATRLASRSFTSASLDASNSFSSCSNRSLSLFSRASFNAVSASLRALSNSCWLSFSCCDKSSIFCFTSKAVFFSFSTNSFFIAASLAMYSFLKNANECLAISASFLISAILSS